MHIFITGANRGIGLSLTRQYAERGASVYATARQPEKATDLNAVGGNVHVLPLDITDEGQIVAAADQVRQHTDHLDLLINNAGVMKRDGDLDQMTIDESLHIMHVNAIAPTFVARAFADLLGKGSRLVNITSQLGSLTRKQDKGRLDYCASKAALNMYTRGLAATFRPKEVITVMVHPGWVQTDMGGQSAAITPDQSAKGIIEVIDGLQPADNGGFFRWDGTIHPW
jgi:NAD(P)-dependent dehydrogenase (short-subunit alcohol dehydrogenase family)